jgi:cysteine-rich repeat protein
VTANHARGEAGGLWNEGTLSIANTILAGNTGDGVAVDCGGIGAGITSGGHNLVGEADECSGFVAAGDQVGSGTDPLVPRLGPLAERGGMTRSHVPLPGSPAIDAGSPKAPGSGGDACSASDQRGVDRPQDGDGDGSARCDAGSVEFRPDDDLPPCDDLSRAIDAGPAGACAIFDGDPASCTRAYETHAPGETASCRYDSGAGTCRACSWDDEAAGSCENTCTSPCDDLFRQLDAGVGDTACWIFDGDPVSCLAAWYTTTAGEARSCWVDDPNGGRYCEPCDRDSMAYGYCWNSCGPSPCLDSERDRVAPFFCGVFDGQPSECSRAFAMSDDPNQPIERCEYDAATGECWECTTVDQHMGLCVNGCATGPCFDTTLTHAGGDFTSGCGQFFDDPVACRGAFETTPQGELASCFYDGIGQDCLACTADAQSAGLCANRCSETDLCGDGVIEFDEQCDDANDVGGDGCTAGCQVESGFICIGEPSACGGTGPQSVLQQRCLREVDRQSWLLAKQQLIDARYCIKHAQRGNTANLGDATQTQTAQACLGNDPRGRIAKRAANLQEREAVRCTGDPAAMPDFAWRDSNTLASMARAESRLLVSDLFGADLDASLAPWTPDKTGALCQQEALKRAQLLFDELGRQALRAQKFALAGTRLPLTTNADDLQAQVLGYVLRDDKGKIARRVQQLADKLSQVCGEAVVSSLFGGSCDGVTTLAEIASCAEQCARCRFCRAQNDFNGLAIACDDYDDGTANGSCN